MTPTILLRSCLTAVAVASLSAGANAQQQTRQTGWPCTGTVDPAYVRVAEATGGVVMLFEPTEISGAADEMAASSRHGDVVFRGRGQLRDGAYELEVPLDSTIASVYFNISVQCLRAVSIVGPSGDELQTDAAGVEYHRFAAIRLFTVAQPTPGSWRVRVAGRGFFSVIVKAETDLRLTDVAFGGGAPVKREQSPRRLAVTMSGAATDVAIRFVAADSATIAPVHLDLETEEDLNRTYTGDVTPPGVDFRVAISGTDARGFRFQRVQDKLVVVER